MTQFSFNGEESDAVAANVRSVAHEFNNLLQAIRGSTRFAMQELPADGQPHQDLEQALKGIDRAALLTNQLLAFGRGEPAKSELASRFNSNLPPTDVVLPTSLASRNNLSIRGGHETILLAEDDSLVRGFALRILSEAGYRVLVATDGEQAVNIYAANADAIALVILDVVMPKMDGRLVYQVIKSIQPEVKVMFCSGGSETDGDDIVVADEVQRIRKPFDPHELLDTARKVLDNKRQSDDDTSPRRECVVTE